MIIKPSYFNELNHYGQYVSDDTSTFGYIPIPKNASSYMRHYININFNWTKEYNYKIKKKNKYIAILRDPYERWSAGIAEYFERNHKNLKINNQAILQFICERVILDTHTEPQVNFLQHLWSPNIVFFKFDKNLTHNLNHFVMKEKLADNLVDLSPINVSSQDESKVKIQNVVKNFIKGNPDYINHIKKAYEFDYDLISRIKFYGSN